MMNRLEEAIIYATIMYQGKVRKFQKNPYILHPLEVAQILSTLTDDEEVITAGILHDVVEDTDGTLAEIEKRFGERVAALVSSESENEYPGEDRSLTWKRRKEEALQNLKNSQDIGVKMLWLADKLANIRSIASVYSEYGEAVWSSLNQSDPAMQCWYYRTVVEEFMGFSYETAVQFFRAFLKHYLGTEDEDRLREVTEKAALPGYSRMIRRIRKKGALSEEDRGRIRLYVEKIAALTEKLDTLSF